MGNIYVFSPLGVRSQAAVRRAIRKSLWFPALTGIPCFVATRIYAGLLFIPRHDIGLTSTRLLTLAFPVSLRKNFLRRSELDITH